MNGSDWKPERTGQGGQRPVIRKEMQTGTVKGGLGKVL